MIHITDFNGDIIDFISKSDGAVTEAEHMINVEDKLETFDFTVLTSRTEHMQKRNRVIIEDKDGQYREFIIYNISSDLNGYTQVQTNASALEDIKTAKPVPPHKLDKHTVKQALEYALADTGWKVSDEAEWGGTRTTSWTGWHDRISILKQLETTYDMRLSFHVEVGSNRIEKRLVSLNKVEPMFNGEEIVYGDNMIDLKRTVDFSDIATALICLGPEDNETGKREIVEVKDDDAQAQFGLPYRYIWDIYEPQSSNENMTKERLTTLGRTALNKRKQESISYEIDGIGLSASAGDMIRVKNEDFTPELYVDAEVVEVTTDLISGESEYKFGVIKEYTRDDVYARFNAMLSGLRERLNKVVENTDSIISERLEEELKYVERYIEKSPTPPLNPKEGQLWLDTSHDGVAVLKRYENGEWVKSSVDDVKDIGGMTREETMYEALKERLVRNEVDYSEVFKRHGALVSEKHYHYVDEDIKNDLTNRYNALQQSYDDFKIAFNNINAEQPTIGLITTAISRAVEFEARLKEYNDSYYVARKSFDEVIALLQSQYSDEKYDELLNEIADSVGGIVQEDGSIDMSEANQKRLDEAMELVANAIGGTWNGNQLIADVPNREELDSLNQSIKQYLNGEIDSLDGKLGKQIETVVNQAKDEFSVAIDSVEKKVDGIEVGGRNYFSFNLENYDTSGLYGYRKVSDDNTSKVVTIKEKNEDVDLKGVYLGFTRNGENANGGFRWEISSGRLLRNFDDDESLRTFNYLSFFPNNQETLDKLNERFYIKVENGNVPTDFTVAPEDVESDINNLSQEVTKNTTSLNVLENEISLKADSDTVKQILDDELEPIKSNVQSNKAELKVQSDLIASKVDSATYEVDKDGIVKDIETNASAIEQTSNSLTSNINSVNKRIDEQDSIIDTNKSSIRQLNNQIALKVDSSTVKQILDSELEVVKSNVQTNQSELKLLSNQISSKVEKSEYTTDINGITQDIKNTKSEVSQLSDSVNSKITSVEQKFENLEIGGTNLHKNSNNFSNNVWSSYDKGPYKITENVSVDEWGATDATKVYAGVGDRTSVLKIYKQITNSTNTVLGETYTVSIYVKNVRDVAMSVNVNGITAPPVDIAPNEAKRVVFTGERTTNHLQLQFRSYDNNSYAEFIVWRTKVEKGNKATDWTPAPEDYQTQIDNQDKILTKHETEIEQNKLGLNTKVSYTEMNGTNKTLEKLLTEFSQTSSGFNFKIDSNGMIQDLTFDRNGFKLNSNLIEFNDGDVVIKDGVTTIKDAYIDKLFSKTAFIEQLKAVDIDLNRATITGGDSTNNIKLDHQSIMSYGIFTRSWGGETDTARLELGLYDGQMRMRNLDTGYRLYLTERGLSTSMAGAIDEFTSGTLEFHSRRFNDTSRGVTMHSSFGAVAMVSDYSMAFIRSNLTANIESDEYSVYIRPYRLTRGGTNDFRFWVKDNDNSYYTDGVLSFGNLTNDFSSGIRFSKNRGLNTVYITNGGGDIGTGNISVKDAEVRGDVRTNGALRVRSWGGDGYNQVIAGAYQSHNSIVFSSHSGSNAYFGVGTQEMRVTNNNGYNDGNTGFRPIRASAFNQGSSLFYKTNIKNIDNIGLSVVRDLTVVEYDLIEDIKNDIENRKQLGFIAEYSESIATIDNKAIDIYRLSAYNTKAIQELAHENDELKSEITELKSQINKIMEMIA